MSTYPEVEGKIIVPWGPGWINSGADGDGIDAVVVGHEIDMRPEGGTVASIEIIVNDGMGGASASTGAELTIGDLMALGNWAYDRAIEANGTDETAGREIQYLQVTATCDTGEEVVWVETVGDFDKATSWSVYARVFDPTDGFVKAEFIRDFEIADPLTRSDEPAKAQAMRLAFLLSAGRWPVEVIDPRG